MKLRSAVVACSSVLLVFENELDVLVGEGHQVGADQGHHSVQNRRLDQVHVPDPPEEPWAEKQLSTERVSNTQKSQMFMT